MKDISKLPYAQWLEQSLQNIVGKPVQSICILTKYDSGDIGTGYYDCSIGDKILFAGYLQQDAMIETLQVNEYIESDENEEDESNG